MFEFVATAVGRTDSWRGNLLLDLNAAVEAMLWLLIDLLLARRSTLIASSEVPRPVGPPTVGQSIVIEAQRTPVRKAA